MAPVGGDARGARDEEIGQTLKIGLIQQQEPVFLVLEHVLAELSGERRQPLGDRGQSRFGLRLSACARAGEVEMIAIEHARLLGRQPEFVLVRLERVDALEQSLVQIGLAAVAREEGRDLALNRLQLVIRVGAGQVEENARHFVQAAAAALQGLNRIGEGRRLGIGGDPVDLRARLFERRVECGPEMLGLETVERRRLEWRGPRFEKRVRVGLGTRHEDSRGCLLQLGG